MDSVDDLEFAEDVASLLARALRSTAAVTGIQRGLKDQALYEWDRYCRPTCRFLDEGECASGSDTCGCPCGHEEET